MVDGRFKITLHWERTTMTSQNIHRTGNKCYRKITKNSFPYSPLRSEYGKEFFGEHSHTPQWLLTRSAFPKSVRMRALLPRSRTGNFHLVRILIVHKRARLTVDSGSPCTSYEHRPINRAVYRCGNRCTINRCINRHAILICRHTNGIWLVNQLRTVEAIGFVGKDKTLRQEG